MYERFIARQPILDGKLKLFGYELLFRAREDTRAGADPKATAQLIVSSTMLSDWKTLLDGACAHVNFGAEEILTGGALLLPKKQTVIDVPGTLEFTDDLVRGIRNLRLAGYRVALDGYARLENTGKLRRLVNFVKVDQEQVSAARSVTGISSSGLHTALWICGAGLGALLSRYSADSDSIATVIHDAFGLVVDVPGRRGRNRLKFPHSPFPTGETALFQGPNVSSTRFSRRFLLRILRLPVTAEVRIEQTHLPSGKRLGTQIVLLA